MQDPHQKLNNFLSKEGGFCTCCCPRPRSRPYEGLAALDGAAVAAGCSGASWPPIFACALANSARDGPITSFEKAYARDHIQMCSW
jgi:hypothetical protein